MDSSDSTDTHEISSVSSLSKSALSSWIKHTHWSSGARDSLVFERFFRSYPATEERDSKMGRYEGMYKQADVTKRIDLDLAKKCMPPDLEGAGFTKNEETWVSGFMQFRDHKGDKFGTVIIKDCVMECRKDANYAMPKPKSNETGDKNGKYIKMHLEEDKISIILDQYKRYQKTQPLNNIARDFEGHFVDYIALSPSEYPTVLIMGDGKGGKDEYNMKQVNDAVAAMDRDLICNITCQVKNSKCKTKNSRVHYTFNVAIMKIVVTGTAPKAEAKQQMRDVEDDEAELCGMADADQVLPNDDSSDDSSDDDGASNAGSGVAPGDLHDSDIDSTAPAGDAGATVHTAIAEAAM